MNMKEITFTKKDITSISFSRGYMFHTITFLLNDGKKLRVSTGDLMTLFMASSAKKFNAVLKRKYYHMED
tara:strand:- start:1172 stop:1381 length:210 start_codon:yes stop_codon:yes gene_type:complete